MADSPSTITVPQDTSQNLTKILIDSPAIDIDAIGKQATAELEASILSPSISKGPCRIKRGKAPETNHTKTNDSMAQWIRTAAKDIRSATDCDALQQKAKQVLQSLDDATKSLQNDIKNKIKEIAPNLIPPLSPFQCPAWINKNILTRIKPDLEAAYLFVKQLTDIITAVTELTKAVMEIEPKLKACALDTVGLVKGAIRGEIQKQVYSVRDKITKSIADAICEGANATGITLKDIDTVLNVIDGVQDFIKNAEQLKDSIKATISSSVAAADTHQNQIQAITGLKPALDTSSPEAFIASLNSDAHAQYQESLQAIIDSPPPVNVSEPVITGTATAGATLTCSQGVWSVGGSTVDNNSFQYEYQWMRNGQEIFGANSSSFVLTNVDIGSTFICMVYAKTAVNIERAASAPTVAVTSSTVTATPTISGTASVGSTLSCAHGDWSPSIVASYSYEWKANGARVQGPGSLSTYVVQAPDAGKSITCVVGAVIGGTTAYATSNSIGIPAAPAGSPVMKVTPAISGTPAIGNTMTCSAGTWDSATTVSYTYQWFRNTTLISGATSSSYTITSADSGTVLKCRVTATNATGSGYYEAISSATVPGPPVNSSAPVITGSNKIGSNLTVSNGSWTGSPTILYTFQWKRGSTDISGATTNTYLLAAADMGYNITCVVTAKNDIGSASATSNIIIPSAAPINTVAPVISGNVLAGNTLTVTNGTWTGSTPITYTYQWYRVGANDAEIIQNGQTSSSYTTSVWDVGYYIRCKVTATNDIGSTQVNSNTFGPPAANPQITATPSITGGLNVGDTLSLTGLQYVGTAPVTITYSWTNNGAEVGTGSTYTIQPTDASCVIACFVTITNSNGSDTCYVPQVITNA